MFSLHTFLEAVEKLNLDTFQLCKRIFDGLSSTKKGSFTCSHVHHKREKCIVTVYLESQRFCPWSLWYIIADCILYLCLMAQCWWLSVDGSEISTLTWEERLKLVLSEFWWQLWDLQYPKVLAWRDDPEVSCVLNVCLYKVGSFMQLGTRRLLPDPHSQHVFVCLIISSSNISSEEKETPTSNIVNSVWQL